ncbi:helicase HerA domain-containing protein [Agromyces sp. S2-1-8]|uniref:helicase HerA domain-containing protein n=1 Tax=Agromyces sp. S2-1-8 TaxID=2897180 RepID=UPI001E2B58AA|nr:DUF87 domain-containing protein [Agromyces sp. S2-1-8]MCD5348105.1 DUF87 domain-containing protein [Agromyces sp. S2-1-8]
MSNVKASKESSPAATWIRRVRLGQATASVLVLIMASLIAETNPFTQWWFWVAATTVITVSVVEPYFTGVSSAMLFSLGAIGAGLTANGTGVEALWVTYFVLAGSVLTCSIVAMAVPPGRTRDGARWAATRFGRPQLLGLSAVGIELVRQTMLEPMANVVPLAVGTLIAVLIAFPDWYQLLASTTPDLGGLATIETAVDPNLLLIASDKRFVPGSDVTVAGMGTAKGVVIGTLAHKGGNRVQIAIRGHWSDVAPTSGQLCTIVPHESTDRRAVAYVTEGSTDQALRVRPFGTLARGATFYCEDPNGGGKHLYQVHGRELVRETWDNSAVIAEFASAAILGKLTATGIEHSSHLPDPYVPVFDAAELSGDLPAGYERIGAVNGTQLPFGLSPDHLRGHHLAILGMSGMGKSTIARRVIDIMAPNSIVFALDGTGEYRSRFGMQLWTDSVGVNQPGAWVHEPAGVQAQKAAEFIEGAMAQASSEYMTGTRVSRTILLEEAHSFLPEWNFTAARNEGDFVARSCRYILQARKFGLSFVLISQRTAVISKSALSQCESYIVLRTIDETSLQYVEGVLGQGFRDTVASLERFQAVCVGPAFNTSTPVLVNLDHYPMTPVN